MNAVILAIGTEVTSGQIQNSHAHWISRKLDDHHIKTILHLAVPDDEKLIHQALEFASIHTSLLFITGGLGPTSDDITRNVVAKWVKKKLKFHEQIWTELQQRLSDRHVKISPSHKNQCYFPEEALILKNKVGSAHGFYIKENNLNIWTLPGPTAELQSIWFDHIENQIKQFATRPADFLKKWRCIGVPESEAADLVEDILKDTNWTVGYRITGPYVEIKVWVPSITKPVNQKKYFDQINHALKDHLISTDDYDIAFDFLNLAFKSGPLTIIDECTNGLLSERLMKCVRDTKEFAPFNLRTLSSSQQDLKDISFEGPGCVLKTLQSEDPKKWKIEIKLANSSFSKNLTFDPKARVYNEKFHRVKAELTIKAAYDLLYQGESLEIDQSIP